jgi:hypothetical protein
MRDCVRRSRAGRRRLALVTLSAYRIPERVGVDIDLPHGVAFEACRLPVVQLSTLLQLGFAGPRRDPEVGALYQVH